MNSATTTDLGKASVALLLGLIDVLANKGVLTRSDLNTVMVDAISKLESMRDTSSTDGAIELVKSLFPEIHGSG